MTADNTLFLSGFSCPAGPILRLSAGELSQIISTSRLRYARFQSLAAILNLLAAPPLLADIDKYRTGILALNGPHNLDIADDFTATLVGKGEKYVNPIQFPFTLQNAVPCELAACYQFFGPALSVGHNEHALTDALRMAAGYLSAGVLDNVLICCSGILEPYYLNTPKDKERHALVLNFFLSKTISPGAIMFTGIPNQGDGSNINIQDFDINLDGLDRQAIEGCGPTPLLFTLKFLQAIKKRCPESIIQGT